MVRARELQRAQTLNRPARLCAASGLLLSLFLTGDLEQRCFTPGLGVPKIVRPEVEACELMPRNGEGG
jgi:hypothetical protein